MKDNRGWFPVFSAFALIICSLIITGCSSHTDPLNPRPADASSSDAQLSGLSLETGTVGDSLSATPGSIQPGEERLRWMPGEVLVVLNDDTEEELGAEYFNGLPFSIIRSATYTWGTLHRLEITDDATVENAVAEFRSDPRVRYAEPNYVRYLDIAPYWPDDPMWEADDPGEDPRDSVWEQWGPAKLGASIAWNDSNGDDEVVVAIIDSGIRSTHQDLTGSLWTNIDEIPDNGIDDDDNGYIDDTWGWNCYQMNNDPYDDGDYCHYHGTGCSGVVAAMQDNEVGITGVAPGVKLMALKVLFANNYTSDATIAEALHYAFVNQADICSMSFGGDDVAEILEEAINEAWDNGNGCLLLASAGNSDSTNDHYPACYDVVMSVGATIPWSRYNDPCDEGRIRRNWQSWWWGSNYGDTLSIMAFGERYYSTYGSGDTQYWDGISHQFFNGTSCACPNAAATMALIKTFHPDQTNQWYWDRLEDTSDDLDVPGYDIQTGNGRVNIVRAVYGADRFADLEDQDGFVPITTVSTEIYDSISDRPGNPFDDDEDLYKITAPTDGCVDIYLDIFTWGESVDMALFSDVNMTNMITDSTGENHYNTSSEWLTAPVVEDENYYLKVYSHAEGDSTTYGLMVEYIDNDVTITPEDLAPANVNPGDLLVPMLKLTFDITCGATLDEILVTENISRPDGSWIKLDIYEDTNGDGVFSSGDTLVNPQSHQVYYTFWYNELGLYWTWDNPMVLFFLASFPDDTESGNTIYISIEDPEDIGLFGCEDPPTSLFPIESGIVTVL